MICTGPDDNEHLDLDVAALFDEGAVFELEILTDKHTDPPETYPYFNCDFFCSAEATMRIGANILATVECALYFNVQCEPTFGNIKAMVTARSPAPSATGEHTSAHDTFTHGGKTYRITVVIPIVQDPPLMSPPPNGGQGEILVSTHAFAFLMEPQGGGWNAIKRLPINPGTGLVLEHFFQKEPL